MNESFHEDFNLNNQIEKGVGTGEALALEFIVDNWNWDLNETQDPESTFPDG